MKRKIIISLFVLLCIFLITGCKKNNKSNKNSNEVKENSNSVVIYFSATGTTKNVAERISKESNSDIIEIIPEEKYTKEDLDYNSDCRANKEQNDSSARPQIKNRIDISKYDVIYLGYPIWWGTNPKIILTLLDSYDFTNKVIFPFCTSESTEINRSVNDLRKYNNKLNIKDGKRFNINDNAETIKNFINND